MTHTIKIWPQYFCRVKDGSKTFEIRENDRGYQPGDIVALWEFDPQQIDHDCDITGSQWKEPRGFTGNSLEFKIGYVLPIDEKRVVFSLLPMKDVKAE